MKLNDLKTTFMLLLFIIAASLSLSSIAGQNQTTKLTPSEEIQQKIQAISNKQNLADDLKKRILASYNESLDNLNELKRQEVRSETLKQTLASLPLASKQLAKDITEAESGLKNRKNEKLAIFPTDELEQRLIIEKTSLSDIDAEISRTEAEIGEILSKQPLYREKISDLKNKQALNLQQQHAVETPSNSENIFERDAKQTWLEIQMQLLNVSLKNLDLENISNPLSLQLEKDRSRLLNLKREQTSLLIGDLENYLLDRRKLEIDKEQEELLQAEKAAAGKHPLIQEATKENIHYNRLLQDITKNTEQFLAQKNELDSHYQQLEKDFQSAEQKINLAGLSPALGNLLREQRRNLPQAKNFSNLNDTLQSEIAKASLESFKLEDAKKNLTDINQALIQRLDRKLPSDMNDADKLRIRSELRMLLNDQKELVQRLSTVNTEYSRVLGDVDFSLQQVLNIAGKYSAYLDQRLLWVPSAPVLDKYYLQEILDSVLWFIDPGNWLQLLRNCQLGVSKHPILVGIGLLAYVFHWRLKQFARLQMQKLLPKKIGGSQHLYNFSQSIYGLSYLLFMSISTPLLLFFIGILLLSGGVNDLFSHAFAAGLFSAALSLALLQFFCRLFKADGIAELLFQWHPNHTKLLHSQFGWSRFVVVPCIFIIAMTGSDVFSEHSYALGRTALIVMMLALTYMFHRFTHPSNGLFARSIEQTGWRKWTPYLLYLSAILLPLSIIGFAASGYYQSALELEQKLIISMRLIFITILLHELAQRWLAVTKRQLALRNARQKRKQGEAAATIDGGFGTNSDLLDISKINQQSHKLLTTIIVVILLLGCWMIWSRTLTAFSIFDRIELWQYRELVDGKDVMRAITLTNVLISLAYASLTFIFSGNFPALVDLISAGKYQMSPGGRYALIQLVRYLLISIAFLVIANELGGSWSQVQWLVAALSVGLGFGLQEIFANMVSGIILLFERPIRVGDTVTIGDVTGKVSRIQMRATHIVDWDRKELVVPNKIFITDRLINWTLSDTVTRLVVPVGVAYGVNIQQVEDILHAAIKNTPKVLTEPHATVTFKGFGDSALLFDVHVFVHELLDRIEVGHCLYKNIYETLQAHQIEIPFPQQDVHIKYT